MIEKVSIISCKILEMLFLIKKSDGKQKFSNDFEHT